MELKFISLPGAVIISMILLKICFCLILDISTMKFCPKIGKLYSSKFLLSCKVPFQQTLFFFSVNVNFQYFIQLHSIVQRNLDGLGRLSFRQTLLRSEGDNYGIRRMVSLVQEGCICHCCFFPTLAEKTYNQKWTLLGFDFLYTLT